jgi:hypothetical protein
MGIGQGVGQEIDQHPYFQLYFTAFSRYNNNTAK